MESSKIGVDRDGAALFGGINLRNLVSHGFLSQVDRRWLALTTVLIQTLDFWHDFDSDEDMGVGGSRNGESLLNVDLAQCRNTPSLRKYNALAKEVLRGKNYF